MTGWTPPALPAQWTWVADRPPWVGRRRELDDLERCWDAVEHGARQVVLVGGDAGAGKSRLVQEVASALHARGVPVLVGQCTSDLDLPFDPLVAPIRTLIAAVDAGRVQLPDDPALPAAHARRLLTRLTSGAGPDAAVAGIPVAAFSAMVSALASACSGGPVVMVLEDLHWAGESALRALRHVVERSADLPLLVLATYRDSVPDASDALASLLVDLLRLSGVHRLRLEGLPTTDVSAYLAALGAGDAASVQQASGVLRDLTGGNPFLLGEVWREVRDRGGLANVVAGRLAVPASLQGLVRRRLGRLAPGARAAVDLGAVIGDAFDVPLVVATGGAGSAAEVFRALGLAAAEGLIVADPRRPGCFRFAHALAREAVTAEMDAYALAAAHAAVGRALERAGDPGDGSRLVRLAHHFSMAAGLGLEAEAVGYLEQAAADATRRMAHSDAGALLERAARLVADPARRDRLLLRAASCLTDAARLDQARALTEAVATTGEPALRLEAAIRYEAACYRIGLGARAVVLLETALAESRLADADPQRVLATAALGRAQVFSGHFGAAEETLERALADARRIGDPALLLAVLTAAVTTAVNVRGDQGLDAFRRGQARAAEAAALADAAANPAELMLAEQVRVYAGYVLGEPAVLQRALVALDRLAVSTQHPFVHWRGRIFAGSRHLMRAEFVEAAGCMADARRLASAFGYGWEQVDGPWSMQSFVHRRETGGLRFARRVLEGGGQLPGNPWGPGLVAIYTELGMADRALAALRATLARDLPELRASTTWPASLCLLAEAAVSLADRASADVLLAEAEPLAGLNIMAAEFLAPFGSADRLLGGLAAVLGRRDAHERFAAALALDSAMGAPLHVATTHAEWAVALRRSHASPERIEGHVRAARALADRYALERVRRLLGVRAGAPPTALPAGLTAREADVLRLVGRGCSNREIARTLYISEHTAANHVRSILAKTQSPNRTAAARFAMQHGLQGEASLDGVE